MSMEAIADLAFSQATGSERDVLTGLAFHAHKDTRLAFPSDQALVLFTLVLDRSTGQRRRLSPRQIQRHLEGLQRAGEIRRVHDGTHRRVFRVDPRAGHQLTLAEEAALYDTLGVANPARDVAAPNDITGDSCDTLAGVGATSRSVFATPTRARVGTSEPTAGNQGTQDDPLKPPKGGDHQSRISFRSGAASAVSARRRRRARKDAAPPPGRCPILDCSPAQHAALCDAWLAFIARLRHADRDGAPVTSLWEMFAAGAHAHEARDGLLVIGCNARTADWLTQRIGRALDHAAGGQARLVACSAAALAVSG